MGCFQFMVFEEEQALRYDPSPDLPKYLCGLSQPEAALGEDHQP